MDYDVALPIVDRPARLPAKQAATKSQRKRVSDDPQRSRHYDKWSRMTVGRMDEDGNMRMQTVTASTGKVHQDVLVERRGRTVGRFDDHGNLHL